VALALEVSPTSSSWRDLAAAASGYGLTKGGWRADRIALDVLRKRIIAPTVEGDDVKGRAEAALRPKVLRDLFTRYNKAEFPPDHIAKNVLQQEMRVPADRVDATLQIIKDNGQFVGFIRDTKTRPFVAVDDPQPRPVRIDPDAEPDAATEKDEEDERTPEPAPPPTLSKPPVTGEFKVFISHGKTMAIVDQVKDVLDLYDIDYEIAVEEDTASIPVTDQGDGGRAPLPGRDCGWSPPTSRTRPPTASRSNNNNVLIEIGAAFVRYMSRKSGP
jgi:hypothetical protein